jgi:hypothetical protein
LSINLFIYRSSQALIGFVGRNPEKASECSPCFSRSCLLAFHELVDLQ